MIEYPVGMDNPSEIAAAPGIGQVVGRNVKKIRIKKKLSQRDLHVALLNAGYTWNRVSIGQLEKSGIGGERLGDLLALSEVLDVTLWELVACSDVTVKGKKVSGSAWMRQVLDRDRSAREPDEETSDRSSPSVHPDPEADARFAALAKITEPEVSDFVVELGDLLRAPAEHTASFSLLRDWLAGIDSVMEQPEARARRGHATRLLKKVAQADEDHREQFLRTIYETYLEHSSKDSPSMTIPENAE